VARRALGIKAPWVVLTLALICAAAAGLLVVIEKEGKRRE